MTDLEAAEYIIKNNHIMVLSTADDAGKPWISPVNATHDHDLNFYWVSSKTANHSKNILTRPQVAFVVLCDVERELDAVYAEAEARVVSDEAEIEALIKLRAQDEEKNKFTVESAADVTGDAIWRIYRATPHKIWKRGDDVKDGQAVTVRKPIDMEEFKL